MRCLILAGGFGTRLYPLTRNRAKALLEYKGQPLINHVVHMVPPDIPILVNTSRRFEAEFRRWHQTAPREVTVLVEDAMKEEEKLGAVGSLHFWIANVPINEDLLVIAADNYFEFSLPRFLASYDGQHTLVAVYDVGDRKLARQFGVVRMDGIRISELQEKPAAPQSSLVATACYVLPSRVFPILRQYCQQGKRDNLGGFIAYLVDNDEVHAYAFTEPWVDIGSVENLASKDGIETT